MDQHAAAADPRPFRPVSVGKCYAQTADQRFGRGAGDVVREREHHQVELGSGVPDSWLDAGQGALSARASLHRRVPFMQSHRNNLTALSQLYNIYMVAYKAHIHVYTPRNVPKQTIPRHPQLRLDAPQSLVAKKVGGYLDAFNPHTINHLHVGLLGNKEILVAAYDDGDVVAYYTHELAGLIASYTSKRPPALPLSSWRHVVDRKLPPKPFFHANVGMSAWGLAIHAKSRLIAVSSNLHEVTVFAPCLSPTGTEDDPASPESPQEPLLEAAVDVEDFVRQRRWNWRIIIPLGYEADNIPNLCFMDDAGGFADRICAVDIRGALWLANIWKPWQPALRYEALASLQHARLNGGRVAPSFRGWNVLPLPNTHFITVQSVEELVGIPYRAITTLSGSSMDTEQSIRLIPDNPCLPTPRSDAQRERAPSSEEDWRPASDAGAVFGSQDDELDGMSDSEADEGMHPHTTSDSEGKEAEGPPPAGAGSQAGGGQEDSEEVSDSDSNHSYYAYDDGPQNTHSASSMPFDGNYGLTQAQPWPSLGQASHGGFPLTAGTDDPSEIELMADSVNWDMETMQSGAGGQQTGASACEGKAPGRGDYGFTSDDMVFFSHEGNVCFEPQKPSGLADLLCRPKHVPSILNPQYEIENFTKHYHVLRFYAEEMEMSGFDNHDEQYRAPEASLLCTRVMRMGAAVSRSLSGLFWATDRLSMLLHLPELSLVVVGSAIGRVLLLTPTRLATPVERCDRWLQYGFRVDWILPRRADERLYRRQPRPLHGIAAGPVQDSSMEVGGTIITNSAGHDACRSGQGDPGRRLVEPRRYRLMLHYRNHDILTYELSRHEETGKVCIF